MQETTLKSIVWQEGNCCVAQWLVVDTSSFGDTRKEAIQNINEKLALYFEDTSVRELPLMLIMKLWTLAFGISTLYSSLHIVSN